MNEHAIIRISDANERKQICGILVANGYTVRLTKVPLGAKNTKQIVIEFWRDKDGN